ncbi:hypothetical protein [Nocardioides pocheonensis]|uniref:Uncharacterized protein n=1 Tax=Nocardioides pocheonensis TaxID=661485 RepID=A0A3N0GJA1_9ACTN|nr:hypothetical protein [Nocardioides pocheonensis]RNM12509.1 hypothetical protein EFL26_17910 [Nocardioides pocheonensis]
MTWTETHRRWQALQEIETRANAALAAGTPLDEFPWTAEYAAIFGDRDALASALSHRWRQARRAQLDTHLPEAVLDQQWRRLQARHAGVLRLLALHEQGGAGCPEDRVPA